MDDPFTPNTGSSAGSALVRDFQTASGEINRIARDEIAPAADLIEQAFSTAAQSITRELGRAAKTGELSLKSLSQALVRDLGRVAIDSLVRKPIQNLLTGVFSGGAGGTGATGFGGARVAGGAVAPGGAFLVGERGPELFVPGSAGHIRPNPGNTGTGMTVNITLPGVRDPETFRQSETQIAASLARVIGRGQRNL